MSWSNPQYFQAKMGYVMLDSSTIGCAQSYTQDANRAISDVQCIGSDSVRKLTGPYSWSVSFDALQILTKDSSSGIMSYEDVMDKFIAGTDASVYFLPKVADVSTGQVYYSGRGYIESISINVAAGEAPTTYSVSVQGNGGLTRNTLS